MPKPLATYLNDLFTKAGVPADNQALKDLLLNTDISKINLPDELMTLADAGIHTLDSAKAKLKPTLFREALNGVDAEIENFINENNFDDASKNELKGEQNTYKKVKLIASKIQALEAAKHTAGKGDTAKLQEEINTLKAQNSAIVKDWETKMALEKTASDERVSELVLENNLSLYDYANLQKEDGVQLGVIKLKKALAEACAKIIQDPANPKQLKITALDGTDYYDKGNKLIPLKTFIEGAIAPILSTVKPPDNNGADNNPAAIITGDKTKVNQAALQKLDAELAQLSQ